VGSVPPPDQKQRDLIEQSLDKTMLVEAAAGTGKTTCMVKRMVALLASGRCQIQSMAAVTFTRKSAAELRSRFQLSLEDALRGPNPSAKQNLERALSRVERCFVGTIHSFCARILRERPAEAGIDPAFREIDEEEDRRLRRKAWDDCVARLYAGDDPLLAELGSVGIGIGNLWESFRKFADYPDVDVWPAPEVEPPDFDAVRDLLHEVASHVTEIEAVFPANYSDWAVLMRKYGRVRRMISYRDLHSPLDLVSILKQFTGTKIEPEKWPKGERMAREENAIWNNFKKRGDEHLNQWRKCCYPTCMKVMFRAKQVYDSLREESGLLNYQDLLMKAVALLEDKPGVRQYFRRRFSHLLVDEFQDTDPVQAQVMMLLTAQDCNETDWKLCKPSQGSLFVVGDPKQSIYRFRRADIVTYNKVKSMVAECGQVVTLQANFRSCPSLIEWVNRTFQKSFPENSTAEAPQYTPLLPGIPHVRDVAGSTIQCLDIPPALEKDQIPIYEANIIAHHIRKAVDERLTLPGSGREVRPGDFMIITRKKRNLALYAEQLQAVGIPHQVTGGNAVNRSRELALLQTCVKAVIQPANPVALVAALRSELFGISDAALYHFKQAGSRFSFTEPVSGCVPAGDGEAVEDAFSRMRKYSGWLSVMPPVAALEKIIADLGLAAWAAGRPDRNVLAGSLMKAVELLREAQRESWSVADLVRYMADLVDGTEKHDSLPVLPSLASAVQVMNLHKVKGLEAPVVFLADPTGETGISPSLYIDRSGERIAGYMVVHGQQANGIKPVVALPSQWETLKEREKAYEQAETVRLLYVAATRAGSQLTIAQRGSAGARGNQRNPWKFFHAHLKECPSLPVFADVEPAPVSSDRVGEEEVSLVLASIESRWQRISTPTYLVAGVKAISVTRTGVASPDGEHGTEWGTVIHSLLQVAMRDRSADLRSLAETFLAEQGMLEPDLIKQALETIESVMASEIWSRAMNSVQRLVEVPFQILMGSAGQAGSPTHTTLRGVIDLAFLEPPGWVIVDYKTDRRSAGQLKDLVEHYRGQVDTYAHAWEAITGQKVAEAGLYFAHPRTYVRVAQVKGL